MIAEALKFLADQAIKSRDPREIDTHDPRHVAYVVDGEIVYRDTPPAPRKHEVRSLDEIVTLAKRFLDAAETPVVWYDENGVTLVIDDEGHRVDTARLPLEPSDTFAKLVELRARPQKMDQPTFIRLLRVDLAGTLDDVVLLAPVRSVKWSSSQTTTADRQSQKESLGKAITSQVETSDGRNIPETVQLMAPVWKAYGLRQDVAVSCAVEVFAAEGAFRLVPLPDQIEQARQYAVARVAEMLDAALPEGVPCYYGKP